MYKLNLQIGEFSKLCGVTVKTLRHYEKLGLLVPDEVDPWTGYRHYHVSQMQQMMAIRRLKEAGFSLDEIGSLLDDGSPAPGVELLRLKLQETEEQIVLLQRRRQMLQEMVDSQQNHYAMEKITIEKLPAVTVASHRAVIDSYESLGPLCVNVIGPEMARMGCRCPQPGYCFTVDHNCEYRDHDIDIEYCEQVEEVLPESDLIKFKRLPEVPMAVCAKCYGPYSKLYQHYTDTFAYIEKQGLKVIDKPRCSYVDGIWNQPDPEKWLTIVQVPVEKA